MALAIVKTGALVPISLTQGANMAKKETHTAFDILTITHVQVFPIKDAQGKTKALARVVVNEQLQLTGLRIMDGCNGLFVAYPNDPSFKGEEYRSIYYPLSKELREHIEHCVLEKFQESTVHA
jgi:stage V sporulation protein G